MTTKQISQLVSADGKPAATAVSAPGCFIHDDVPIPKNPDISWGRVFSEPSSGNKVDFYVTGEEYFTAVAHALATAKKTIFIAGWQVNFDVELSGGKTLYQILETAIDANPALRVYVMPWLSPKAGVDTGDFETMLAIYQLNAGLPPPARAFALPAISQSDMPGGLGITFSHHQKLVIVDEERAFVGGIDLAYGRRDDGRFSLAHNGRVGNELYNSCVPPIHELTTVEQADFLTRSELLCACFQGAIAGFGAWWESGTWKPVGYVMDGVKSVSDFEKDTQKKISDAWNATDIMPEFIRKLQDMPIEMAQNGAHWTYREINEKLGGKLESFRQSGTAHAKTVAAVVVAWLNNASLEQLPAELHQETVKIIEQLGVVVLKQLSISADSRDKRYKGLRRHSKIVPKSGKVISSAQPRMPWHDVHSSITGPAVSDLTRNFMRRWNGVAHRYETSYASNFAGEALSELIGFLRFRTSTKVHFPRLKPTILKQNQKKSGSCWVQVLRSGPKRLQQDEQRAEHPGAGVKQESLQRQNNCLKAMLTQIHSAQQFIYIENQFFQSHYGTDSTAKFKSTTKGPMSTLTDVSAIPGYERYAKRLNIYGASWEEIPSRIDWSQLDDIRRDIKHDGNAFIDDLKYVLANIASNKATLLLGKPQETLLNPVGSAIAARIEKAIYDGQPFHVYAVLPVHPEGTLNTINIMTQLHLTMQSLVFGSDSLVNRIRRALRAMQLKKRDNVSLQQAKRAVEKVDSKFLEELVGEDWKEYLTLLNLRNWDVLEKRPVTEQIYVHSKLLVVDDRVAVLGSANINDRSQLGDRDSELAVIIRDDAMKRVALDGENATTVSLQVHNLRVRLWKKLFGLMGSAHPATSLANVIDKPASRETWRAIQKVAHLNALAYASAFRFLPVVQGKPSSIWSTWNREKQTMDHHMPFNERFWRDDEVRDETRTWDAKSRAPEKRPVGVKGFIVELPTTWTQGENNFSAMNLTILAENETPQETNEKFALENRFDQIKADA